MDATDLQRFIDENDVEAHIVFLEDQTPTVETAAAVLGVQPVQIVKTLLFMEKDSDAFFRPHLVVANGLSRVSYKKLADYLGISRRRLRIASPEQVQVTTGYRVGTVPPFGHKRPLPTLLDRGVLDQGEIYGGGGAINALVHLTVAELERILETDVVDVGE